MGGPGFSIAAPSSALSTLARERPHPRSSLCMPAASASQLSTSRHDTTSFDSPSLYFAKASN